MTVSSVVITISNRQWWNTTTCSLMDRYPVFQTTGCHNQENKNISTIPLIPNHRVRYEPLGCVLGIKTSCAIKRPNCWFPLHLNNVFSRTTFWLPFKNIQIKTYTAPIFPIIFCKGKATPLQAWTGPEDSRSLRLPEVHSAHKGGKVVSPMHQLPLAPENISGTHFR